MADAQDRYIDLLFDRLRSDRYPSGELMNRLEASLTPDRLDEYLEILFEKLDDGHYPSKQLLDRVARLAPLSVALQNR